MSDLRSVLAVLESDPRAIAPRDELRRKLHALGASARLLHFDAMAANISDAEGLLEPGPRAAPLGAPELDQVGRTLDDLPALAWGEGPPEPRVEASLPALPTVGLSALVVGPAELADALTEGIEGGESIFECERTEQTQQALGLARALAPDVVIVDEGVPGALALVESLLDDPLTEPVPIVVLGAFSGPEQAARFVALGVARTLAKPVSPATLRGACHEVIDQREGRTLEMRLGEPTLEQLGDRLAEEVRRALVDSVAQPARAARVPLGEGAEVIGAVWGAIARVREIVTLRTNGAVRFPGDGPEGAVAMAPWLHPEVAGSERAALSKRGRGAAAEVSLERRVVVVADDDPGVTWFISDLLRTTGCIVHEALDGLQALKLAHELSPELVVSDILMPGLDGFALCRALRRDVALSDTPVILLSWKEDLLQRVRELGASAAAYLRKESDARAIVARVREVLRPRARVETRLRGEGEVRGRLDGITVHSLLHLVSTIRPSARVLVRDASFLYEVDFLGGAPRRATRTATSGTFEQGERVLAALLGVGAGRFVVTPLPADLRVAQESELRGSLDAQLARPVRHARAMVAAATGANTMNVRRVVVDASVMRDYLGATPEPALGLVQKLSAGAAPRDLLLSGDTSPALLEDVIADLAARGAIRAVEREGAPPSRPTTSMDSGAEEAVGTQPSPVPRSELVARELPAVRDTAAPSSSLEDAVMRAMSDSPSKPPPSSEQPPIVEPSELRPRSSNPPAESSERRLASLPPDAIVPGASSGEILAAPDASKTEPMTVAVTERMGKGPLEASIPIDVEASRSMGLPARSVEGPEAERTSGWKVMAVLLGVAALVVVGGIRWFLPVENGDVHAAPPAGFSDPDVSFHEIPAGVSVPEGQGLLEVGAHAGEAVRIDGAEGSLAPPSGTIRQAATVGTHLIHVGVASTERSRMVEVRAGRMTHVAFDAP